jgi:hypothetical protein
VGRINVLLTINVRRKCSVGPYIALCTVLSLLKESGWYKDGARDYANPHNLGCFFRTSHAYSSSQWGGI